MPPLRKLLVCGLGLLMLSSQTGGAAQDNTTHFIIEVKQSCLIGATRDRKWVEATQVAKTLKPGQKLQLFTLRGPAGETTIDKVEDGDCPDQWLIEGTPKANEGIAISSPTWNVMPRKPRPIDSKDTTYVTLLTDLLKKEGIQRPDVKISEGYKIDLNGDGVDEVVILANRSAQGVGELTGVPHGASPGDYQIVLVRSVIKGKAQNIFLVKDIRLKGNEGSLVRNYHLSAIADINGDGVMEIVLYSAYYEGSSSDVIQITGTNAKGVIGCSCEH